MGYLNSTCKQVIFILIFNIIVINVKSCVLSLIQVIENNFPSNDLILSMSSLYWQNATIKV